MPKKRSLDSQIYERLFSAFAIALAVVDRKLVIQYSNRTFSKVFAVRGNAAGVPISNFFPFAEIETLVSCAGSQRSAKEAELQLESLRGGSAFFRTTVIPFTLKKCARDSLFLVTLEDVSERARLEEQLLQAEKLSAMGQMAASIVHELGNPLGIMITSLEYLRHCLQQSSGELQEEVGVMRENAERMHELLAGLTDLSGLQRFQLEMEDIHRAIIPVLSFVGKMAEKSGITVKTDLASELPCCPIDLRQLKQVFLNLMKNAMEAMPKGGTIIVRSRYRPGLPECPPAKAPAPSADRWAGAHTRTGGVPREPGFITVEVEDTGSGIPPGDLESIFRPFYSTKKKGMGLGLSLCQGIIEKHGGKVWATSHEDKGSCFIVEIPVDRDL
ncbi:MAG: nitrogen regulation protein NR(II) [Thermodesulfobacteriota bacterium]